MSQPAIDFIDLKAQQERIRPEIDRRIKQVLDHGHYVLGPEVTELEKALAKYTGAKHCISCASGTDALLMPLMAYGIGPGDAVFTTPFTFMATAEVVSLLGATPVFVDIDEKTYNIDPAKLAEAIDSLPKKHPGLKPRGIIPVDLFGQPADYDEIGAIAKAKGLFVMQDGAQSFGASYKGKRVGSQGDVSTTSFFPAKPLGCYGDGGAIFTDSDELAHALDSIRVHGKGSDKYDNVRIGINGRLDTIQAAILLVKLGIFDEEVALRNRVAARYSEALKGSFTTPFVAPDRTSVWAQYSLLASGSAARDKLIGDLKGHGIPTAVYYPKPLHLQTAYRGLGYQPGSMPVSERVADRIFSLPMHPYVSDALAARIVEAVRAVR